MTAVEEYFEYQRLRELRHWRLNYPAYLLPGYVPKQPLWFWAV